MKKTWMATASITFLTTSATAQIPVDLTQANVTIEDNQTLKIENLKVPDAGSFQLMFRWNPATATFEPQVQTLIANGSYCEKATASGSTSATANKDGYVIWQRTNASMTVGALAPVKAGASSFTVTWAKTNTASENPYLVGQSVSKYNPNNAYGIVGKVYEYAYPGFTTGMLVEVTANMASGNVTIRQVAGGSANAVFSYATAQWQRNCPAAPTGIYSGDVSASANVDGYQASFSGSHSGGIAAINSGASAFTASWWPTGVPGVSGKRGFEYGAVNSVYSFTYPNFVTNSNVFVADVGGGISVTQIDASAKATATAAFLRK